MTLKYFISEFAGLGKEKSFRFDVDYINFQHHFLIEQYYPFNFLVEFKNSKVSLNDISGDFYYSEIGNVTNVGEVVPVKLNFDQRHEENDDYFKKIEKGDIIKAEEEDILMQILLFLKLERVNLIC